MKVLLADPSHRVQSTLRAGLACAGLTVDAAFTDRDAEASLRAGHYDAALISTRLPATDGYRVVQRLRAEGDRLFVLMLAASVDDTDAATEAGADGVLLHPVSQDTLVSRLLARPRPEPPNAHTVRINTGAVTLDIDLLNRTASTAAEALALTPTEYKLLVHFATHRQQTFSQRQLIDRVYESDKNVSLNAVEAHISALRRKLRTALGDELITTRRGFGYHLA
ncbi:MAG: response regulator transcription factor [Pseudomonadota bacterium]